ncbi:MAG: triose-phosphate isomerase [Planctomycetota bacterium]
MSDRKPYVGGNWKMNTDHQSASDLARGVADGLAGVDGAEAAVFPPFPYLAAVGAILRERQSSVKLGAQDVYHESDGAFTGEISAAMLKDVGVSVVLAGHSERRHVIGEDDTLINAKVRAALDAGLEVILCVGETLEQREAGQTDAVNERQTRAGLANVGAEQLGHVTIAYEPVWAIGTGRTASPEDAQNAHAKIRAVVAELFGIEAAGRIRIQYGGSVKPGNAAELMAQADIDGGLIGGASLKAGDFCQIVRASAPAMA